MKILILTNYDVGLYKFRKEVLEKLLAENHELFVSLPNGQFVKNIIDMGCKYLETPMERRGTNPLKDLSLYNMYCSYIKNIKPDVILTYTIKPNVYGGMAAQRFNIPYICNITGLGSALENGGLLGLFTKTLYKIGLRKANKVFCQNEANLKFMIDNKIVKDNYDLLPGSGVNLSQFEVKEYPDDTNVNFVFVGRMMKEKGFELYLDAAEIIHERYPQSKFHICGIKEEDYYKRVEDLDKKGICVYHGLVDDMPEIYKDMHCIVHPTYYPEGMSNVLLEACACGRPIITTDRPGCKEIVDDNINGYIVKQKDLDDLVDKLDTFMKLDNNKRKQMGLEGRKKVEKQFDRQIVVDKYLEEISKYEKS